MNSATVDASFLLTNGTTVAKTYTVAPNGRRTIYVDNEDFPGGKLLASGNVVRLIDTATLLASPPRVVSARRGGHDALMLRDGNVRLIGGSTLVHPQLGRIVEVLEDRTPERPGIVLRVRDYGVGLDNRSPGAGIRGMRERALLVGADLSIRSPQDGGTEVTLSLPLKHER